MKTLAQIVILSLLSVVIHYTVYYRFTPNYLTGLFSEEGFRSSYEKSVFKYRFVGTKLQIYIYEQLKKNNIEFKENVVYSKRLIALDENADSQFYASYFVLNTLSCTITAILLLLIYNFNNTLNENQKIITISIIILFIGFTQFVVTPYDNLSYACFALSFYFFLIHEQKQNLLTLVLLSISILIATLVRESSLLIICAITSVYLFKTGNNIKLTAKKILLPCMAFMGAYIGVRYFIPGEPEVVEVITFTKNIFNLSSTSKIMAIVFLICLMYFLWSYAKQGNFVLIRTFVLLSTPYLVMVLVAGLIIEFRLWVPFILGIVLLNNLNTAKIQTGTNQIK